MQPQYPDPAQELAALEKQIGFQKVLADFNYETWSSKPKNYHPQLGTPQRLSKFLQDTLRDIFDASKDEVLINNFLKITKDITNQKLICIIEFRGVTLAKSEALLREDETEVRKIVGNKTMRDAIENIKKHPIFFLFFLKRLPETQKDSDGNLGEGAKNYAIKRLELLVQSLVKKAKDAGDRVPQQTEEYAGAIYKVFTRAPDHLIGQRNFKKYWDVVAPEKENISLKMISADIFMGQGLIFNTVRLRELDRAKKEKEEKEKEGNVATPKEHANTAKSTATRRVLESSASSANLLQKMSSVSRIKLEKKKKQELLLPNKSLLESKDPDIKQVLETNRSIIDTNPEDFLEHFGMLSGNLSFATKKPTSKKLETIAQNLLVGAPVQYQVKKSESPQPLHYKATLKLHNVEIVKCGDSTMREEVESKDVFESALMSLGFNLSTHPIFFLFLLKLFLTYTPEGEAHYKNMLAELLKKSDKGKDAIGKLLYEAAMKETQPTSSPVLSKNSVIVGPNRRQQILSFSVSTVKVDFDGVTLAVGLLQSLADNRKIHDEKHQHEVGCEYALYNINQVIGKYAHAELQKRLKIICARVEPSISDDIIKNFAEIIYFIFIHRPEFFTSEIFFDSLWNFTNDDNAIAKLETLRCFFETIRSQVSELGLSKIDEANFLKELGQVTKLDFSLYQETPSATPKKLPNGAVLNPLHNAAFYDSPSSSGSGISTLTSIPSPGATSHSDSSVFSSTSSVGMETPSRDGSEDSNSATEHEQKTATVEDHQTSVPDDEQSALPSSPIAASVANVSPINHANAATFFSRSSTVLPPMGAEPAATPDPKPRTSAEPQDNSVSAVNYYGGFDWYKQHRQQNPKPHKALVALHAHPLGNPLAPTPALPVSSSEAQPPADITPNPDIPGSQRATIKFDKS